MLNRISGFFDSFDIDGPHSGTPSSFFNPHFLKGWWSELFAQGFAGFGSGGECPVVFTGVFESGVALGGECVGYRDVFIGIALGVPEDAAVKGVVLRFSWILFHEILDERVVLIEGWGIFFHRCDSGFKDATFFELAFPPALHSVVGMDHITTVDKDVVVVFVVATTPE